MSIGDQPISEFMTAAPISVGTEQTLTHAAERMREHNIRHLPVLHGGQLYGILSQRDVGLVAGLNDVNPDETAVEEAASQETYTVAPTTPVREVIAHMAEHKIGSALVVQSRKVIGIFTDHDAMKLLAKTLA